jgi:hypothetical protein
LLAAVLLPLTVVCCDLLASASRAHAALGDCGQPVSAGGAPTASDALFILGAAVGVQTCELCVCDTNNSGGVTAGDALTTLSAAVGTGAVLTCEPCDSEPASCFFDVIVSGDTAATFDGPAQFEIAGDGSITFTLRSRGYINDNIPASILANFVSEPINPLAPGAYDVASADIRFVESGYQAFYLPGVEGVDCDTCGGSIILDSIVEEQSISGSATVTMVRVVPPPDGGELPPVTMNVSFKAAFGSQFDFESPYVQCSTEYAQ